MNATRLQFLALVPLLLFLAACSDEPAVDAAPTAADRSPYTVESVTIGNIGNVHRCGDALLAGQPAEEEFILLKEHGVERVLDLRTQGEVQFDELAAVQEAGFDYVSVPFRGAEDLTDEKIDQVRAALREAEETPLFLHCGSANRVGAVWLAWRVLDAGGVSFDEALVDAKEIGLRNDPLTERVREYVSARQEEGE